VTRVGRIPPGRAGRLWLLDRLRSGRLAASLLDRKVTILRAERQKLQAQAETCHSRWVERCHDADRWGMRAALLGGEREFRNGAPAGGVEVVVAWGSIMGARYPLAATVRPAEQVDRAGGTAALIEAAVAYRSAVEAAAAHAVAEAALRTIDAELKTTGRRLRAITDRWLPRLQGWLATVTRELDEAEREESFRLRWARSGANGDGSGDRGAPWHQHGA
jgi:V/A-type H+/Na+-transporting ATPase subunit D